MTMNRNHHMNRTVGLRARSRIRRRRAGCYSKPTPGSRRELKATLESLNAKFVKMRDGYQCKQCAFDGAPSDGVLDAGHLYPKGKFPATKYDVENIFAQCRRHNMIHIRRPESMFTWFLETHAQADLEALHARAVSGARLTDDDLRDLIALREKQIAELECHRAAMV